MSNSHDIYPCPYLRNTQTYYSQCYNCPYRSMYDPNSSNNNLLGEEMEYDSMKSAKDDDFIVLRDYGPAPFVVNINDATLQNDNFRTALWTGKHLQLTLMSINVGEDIGLEIHPNLDQFIRIEEGQGIVKMGTNKNNLNFQRRVSDDFAFIIPAGTWHNLINTGNKPIKLYSIYAPPQHLRGTVHRTKADAEAAEMGHRND